MRTNVCDGWWCVFAMAVARNVADALRVRDMQCVGIGEGIRESVHARA